MYLSRTDKWNRKLFGRRYVRHLWWGRAKRDWHWRLHNWDGNYTLWVILDVLIVLWFLHNVSKW